MRLKILLFLIMSGATCLTAQTQAGNWRFGVRNFSPGFNFDGFPVAPSGLGISFGKEKIDAGFDDIEADVFELGLNFSGGYFVTDALSVGLNVAGYRINLKNEDAEASLSTFMVGPDVRYYFPAKGNVQAFLNGSTNFGRTTSEDLFESEANLFSLNFGVGIAYFITPYFSLDGSVSFNRFRSKQEDPDFTSTANGVGIQLGFSAFLGGTKATTR